MSLCHISAGNRNSDVFLITYLPVGYAMVWSRRWSIAGMKYAGGAPAN
ncbi:hypothetical protein RA11412_0844 [Rothia aeria]|uniref:Uncharacterized protein n=1 Tax=Rothia aeria TaxID=172042 RepID=A0A2Z5QXS3_9MICC|nr:hypothetical protein RA11412_0844 [Rothia aeria]